MRLDSSYGRWTITAHSLKLRHDPMLWSLVTDARPGEEISPAQVQFLIARDEARDQGRTITAQTTDDEMRLSF